MMLMILHVINYYVNILTKANNESDVFQVSVFISPVRIVSFFSLIFI